METAFNAYCESKELFSSNDKVLLGVSGGIDSMVMLELFRRMGLNYGVAHCNFQLRGNDSDADEDFVAALVKEQGVPFYSKRFETEAFRKEHKISLQEAARDLRYQWFETIRKKHGYDRIAVAHHQDDSIETFFINLIRGTGLPGLKGILPKTNNLIRPMLFANREQINGFATKEGLAYREDESNKDLKYKRNKIRHKLIPLLKELNPGLGKTMMGNMHRLSQSEMIYKEYLNYQVAQLVEENDSSFRISIGKLQQLRPAELYLFEALKPFNFNAAVTKEIFRSIKTSPGKKFYSPTHMALKDRDQIIIQKIMTADETGGKKGKINKGDGILFSPVKLSVNKLRIDAVDIKPDPMIANLDGDKLSYPLTVRRWEHGDSFFPLGMSGKKKLSDFFIDLKVPLSQKDNIFVLESAGDIVWVIGYRLDDRYKISSQTKRVHLFEYANGS